MTSSMSKYLFRKRNINMSNNALINKFSKSIHKMNYALQKIEMGIKNVHFVIKSTAHLLYQDSSAFFNRYGISVMTFTRASASSLV